VGWHGATPWHAQAHEQHICFTSGSTNKYDKFHSNFVSSSVCLRNSRCRFTSWCNMPPPTTKRPRKFLPAPSASQGSSAGSSQSDSSDSESLKRKKRRFDEVQKLEHRSKAIVKTEVQQPQRQSKADLKQTEPPPREKVKQSKKSPKQEVKQSETFTKKEAKQSKQLLKKEVSQSKTISRVESGDERPSMKSRAGLQHQKSTRSRSRSRSHSRRSTRRRSRGNARRKQRDNPERKSHSKPELRHRSKGQRSPSQSRSKSRRRHRDQRQRKCTKERSPSAGAGAEASETSRSASPVSRRSKACKTERVRACVDESPTGCRPARVAEGRKDGELPASSSSSGDSPSGPDRKPKGWDASARVRASAADQGFKQRRDGERVDVKKPPGGFSKLVEGPEVSSLASDRKIVEVEKPLLGPTLPVSSASKLEPRKHAPSIALASVFKPFAAAAVKQRAESNVEDRAVKNLKLWGAVGSAKAGERDMPAAGRGKSQMYDSSFVFARKRPGR